METITIKVTSGPNRLNMLWPVDTTIASAKEDLSARTGIAVSEQKLIHRGKYLSDPSATLASCGVRDNDKLMVIRAKPDFENDPSYLEVVDLLNKCAPLFARLRDLEESINNFSSGYLPENLKTEALPKIKTNLRGVNEGFMKVLEKLDALRFTEDQKEAKLKRKDVVVRIQTVMDKVDGLLKQVDEDIRSLKK
ncbi:unnamed protein product [Notodromas monacha]|uniref:BAG family molecular chaperone regulator 1 n=1 Tax=Notodromas monacha TaxID=399045 RepID=A0A7R9BVU6_9CRUS|nr:unnamed protein product [Notodromas monacha]CAG0921596.1 unnamed protein product [Notodromas monacha]